MWIPSLLAIVLCGGISTGGKLQLPDASSPAAAMVMARLA
tara:strand:+ start:780 stop:899 length:120 start_codon:yes stop_codon:yes gene_type:complete